MSHLSLMLLVLLLLAAAAQGIRSGPMSVASSNHQEFHGRMERNIIEGGSGGEAVIGTNGQYSGSNRKFVASNLPTTSKIAKSEGMKVEAKTNNPASGEIDHNREDFAVKSSTAEHQRPNERYPDIVDIAGMDYSPAKRKPPIHN